MPNEYQQNHKKIIAYAPKIYNDPNMSEKLKEIYRTLETRFVHEGRFIHPTFYQDPTKESVAKFNRIGFECLLSLDEQICPMFIMEFYKTLRLGLCLYSDAWSLDQLERTLEKIPPYNSILPSLEDIQTGRPYNLVYFIVMRMNYFRDRSDKVLPYGMILRHLFKKLKATKEEHPFDERYILVPRKMSSHKAKQPKRPPPRSLEM
ncbi:hypothetical protein Tco_1310642 [Tanacetum coccineum]